MSQLKLYFVLGREGGEVAIKAPSLVAARKLASKFGSNVAISNPELTASWAFGEPTDAFDTDGHRRYHDAVLVELSRDLGRSIHSLSVLSDEEIIKADL